MVCRPFLVNFASIFLKPQNLPELGKFKGKMILLGSLLDREAFPWQCDWYRDRVKEHLGESADDNFRLWYTENALHGDLPEQLEDPTRVVSYIGVLQQALRDLSAWVENGVEPPGQWRRRFCPN